jgi:hypothetical protein
MVSRKGIKALKDGKAADNRWHIRKEEANFMPTDRFIRK